MKKGKWRRREQTYWENKRWEVPALFIAFFLVRWLFCWNRLDNIVSFQCFAIHIWLLTFIAHELPHKAHTAISMFQDKRGTEIKQKKKQVTSYLILLSVAEENIWALDVSVNIWLTVQIFQNVQLFKEKATQTETIVMPQPIKKSRAPGETKRNRTKVWLAIKWSKLDNARRSFFGAKFHPYITGLCNDLTLQVSFTQHIDMCPRYAL